MQIDCITAGAAMALLAPEWAGLWRLAPEATPFQSPAWLLAWWRHFGSDAPRILTARRAGRLVAVLPLYLRSEPQCRKLLPVGIGLSDYIDALVAPDCTGAAEALFAAVADLDDWDECHMPDLAPGALLAAARCPARLRDTADATVTCPVLALPQSEADLVRIVPRKTLRDVRQAGARAAAFGGTCIERADRDTLPAIMADLFRLHDKRWQRRGESGVVADPEIRAFHVDAARALEAEGLLRLYRLAVEGDAIAVYYGFVHGTRAYAYLGGFDPDRPRLSPGAEIMRHAIAEAIADGAREFHLLRGGEAYKYAWGAVDRWNTARTLKRR